MLDLSDFSSGGEDQKDLPTTVECKAQLIGIWEGIENCRQNGVRSFPDGFVAALREAHDPSTCSNIAFLCPLLSHSPRYLALSRSFLVSQRRCFAPFVFSFVSRQRQFSSVDQRRRWWICRLSAFLLAFSFLAQA